MTLEDLRKNIDKIDAELVRLLNKRMEMTMKTRNLKSDVKDSEREEKVLEKIRERSLNLIRPQFSEEVFKAVMKESKDLQAQNFTLVGFQGEHGAYSEVAVREHDSKAVPIPHSNFADVFDGVKSGQLDLGIAPVENSVGGSVAEVNDLLVGTELKVAGEIILPIRHCLLSLPEADYRDIRAVYSHPQALSQCRGFISRNKLEPRPYYDTAGAAMMLAFERPVASAAIASKLCAELYNLEILKENIEDKGGNKTRFLLLSKEPAEKGDKCSMVFSTAHKPGALFKVLEAFSDADINLTRIESKPVAMDPGKYAFFLDFQGSDKDSKVVETMEKVKEQTAMLNFLGCYKEAKL